MGNKDIFDFLVFDKDEKRQSVVLAGYEYYTCLEKSCYMNTQQSRYIFSTFSRAYLQDTKLNIVSSLEELDGIERVLK